MDVREWRVFVERLRELWGAMWRERIDDDVRAEGVASGDYDPLFVEQGTVVVATRDYRPPRFGEILERHAEEKQPGREVNPHPSVGGWGRFIREVINKQRRYTKGGRRVPSQAEKEKQHKRKNGEGWLRY